MMGVSLAHAFNEPLKFLYAKSKIFRSFDALFPHQVVSFVRFDTKQLQKLKSCQLQVGVVNRKEFEVLRPYLTKHNRVYQSEEFLTSLTTSNFTWGTTKWSNSSG